MTDFFGKNNSATEFHSIECIEKNTEYFRIWSKINLDRH